MRQNKLQPQDNFLTKFMAHKMSLHLKYKAAMCVLLTLSILTVPSPKLIIKSWYGCGMCLVKVINGYVKATNMHNKVIVVGRVKPCCNQKDMKIELKPAAMDSCFALIRSQL